MIMNVVIKIILVHVYLYQLTFGFKCTNVSDFHIVTYDYYWRDYFGKIPSDALPGGKDVEGNPTYIGQTYIENKGLLPGTIYADCHNIRVSASCTEFSSNENVKILCAKNHQNFAWISTTSKEADLLLHRYHILVGGRGFNQPLYIGRANSEGELRLGKVYLNSSFTSSLHIPLDNQKAQIINCYELLVYRPDTQNVSNTS